MIINIDIDDKEFPMLSLLKEHNKNDILKKIFTLGYETYFPNITLDNSKNENKLINKIDTLENALNNLIGLSSSSSKKGELAENILHNIIMSRYGDITYNVMSQVNHSGDAWIKFDSFDDIIMLEIKNYINKVNKDEITKMKDDMITNNIR